MKFVRDLFMGPGNKAWDLARIVGAKAVGAYTAAFLYSVFWLKQTVDWSSLGVGYSAILVGAAAMIMGKDWAGSKVSLPTAPGPGGAEPGAP